MPQRTDQLLTAQDVMDALAEHADAQDAVFLQRYFKTGPGQYGEGDQFIGVRVPNTRKVCRRGQTLPVVELEKLLQSPIHEHRLAAVILMTLQYPKADSAQQTILYELYLQNVRGGRINNWDIVDVSAPNVVGAYLLERPRDILFSLAAEQGLWSRRVAVLATFQFLKHGDPSTSLALAELLLHDKEDLMHKAIGWMLREMGGQGMRTDELAFLDNHAAKMPRTMLRYAIEHFTPAERQYYMTRKQA